MELLSPAGDEAALRAAVCAGADAVYLGFASFGARAAAANFDAEALAKAIDYAHLYHVRVYVTVNTLVKQKEMEAVYAALQTIYQARADAVILQDMGVLRMAREAFPTLALHASTQMALHSAAGARMAAAHGVSRVVLARECTLRQAAEVAATGVETEAFVHGAQCASVSGQCLLSSMAGGRSGNRGRCAQPCRQAVTLGQNTAALLSMKDLCLRDRLPELQQAGITSLKIEGRLKRAEYVAVVTQSYRKALDALARGTFRPADKTEKEALMQIYHRGGFTEGHLMGEEDASLCATARVGHEGVAIGKIISVQRGLAVTSLRVPLNDGDSLRVASQTDVELRYSGHAQDTRATLRLREGETVRVGDALYRTADAAQLLWAQHMKETPIPVQLRIRVLAGEAMMLEATDGQTSVQAVGDVAQTPIHRPLSRADIERQLGKLGDSPFVLQGTPLVTENGAFATVASLNALRREALQRLMDARRAAFFGAEREAALAAWQAGNEGHSYTGYAANQTALEAALRGRYASPVAMAEVARNETNPPASMRTEATGKACIPASGSGQSTSWVNTLAVTFDQAASGKEFLAAGANLLLYAPRDVRREALAAELPYLPEGAWVTLPPQLSDAAYADIAPLLRLSSRHLGGIVLGSVGQLGFDSPLPIALGDGVPVTNQEAARELLSERVSFCTLWPELSRDELSALMLSAFPTLLRMYGRERVMVLNHCPERVTRGFTRGRAACALCKQGHRACASADAALRDRRGYTFPLMRTRAPEGCVIEVYNALPTDLAPHDARRRELGAGMLLSFTTEPVAEQMDITERFASLMRNGVAQKNPSAVTSGHFLRGVE